jgi:hypothetical protein
VAPALDRKLQSHRPTPSEAAIQAVSMGPMKAYMRDVRTAATCSRENLSARARVPRAPRGACSPDEPRVAPGPTAPFPAGREGSPGI